MKTIIITLSLLFAMPILAHKGTKGFNYAKHYKAKKRKKFMNKVFNLNKCKNYKQHK